MEGIKNEKDCMYEFSLIIKHKVDLGKYDECLELIYKKMAEFPHDPVPHNLLGILMEIKGNHLLAMKHLRAAWALDPSYTPASINLDNMGSNGSRKLYVFS
ncbi:tetratricopeptide repeat protein [Finegoldia magna]|uniref:Tetratricopeptide repeat protein n=3 Tax=Finegoldia magna TaxID=1260 RepID=A0A233V431_FINMA|nr:hypothetical protein [Finegoldia magna]EFH92812.1 hypothetical protein HMPREF0391_11784 [Finegoldia magna ATCC 53516]MBS5776141.1 hypothetical protein [Finegoldia magna]MBS5942223.1 hypothetical protein [Finegoldia magna]MBS5964536.1 hypothetical protein [Finegoldia magna]MDU1011116.1 hypothetical protein [Finegoldia magna]